VSWPQRWRGQGEEKTEERGVLPTSLSAGKNRGGAGAPGDLGDSYLRGKAIG
jgi:hypothetical protein